MRWRAGMLMLGAASLALAGCARGLQPKVEAAAGAVADTACAHPEAARAGLDLAAGEAAKIADPTLRLLMQAAIGSARAALEGC